MGIQKLPTQRTLKELSISDFPMTFVFERKEGTAEIRFNAPWDILYLSVKGFDSPKTTDLYHIIERTLELKEPTENDRRNESGFPAITRLLWSLHDKIESLSRQVDQNHEKRCFVSFRFDDHSKALALELKEFLELVGVQIVSGLGYEPRSVSEKVLDRLAGPLDLFIVIFSSAGDSAWLNQEIGVARGRKLPIMVLKEEDSEVKSAILGDAEYLSFPKDNISKTFVGLLQALWYVDKSRNR